MKITHEEIRHASRVMRIHIPEEQFAGLAAELEGIFETMEPLLAADLDGLTLTAGEHCNRFHEDQPTPSLTREQVLSNAPAREAGCVLVPRVMEE